MKHAGIAKAWTAIVAGTATLAMALTGAAAASADEQASDTNSYSITLNAGTSLADRTFEAYEPITITGTAPSGDADTATENYTLAIPSAWLSTVRSAAIKAGLTTDGKAQATDKSNVLKNDSTEATVLDAVSALGQNQNADLERAFAEALSDAITTNKLTPAVKESDWKNVEGNANQKKATVPGAGWYLVRETTKPDTAAPSGSKDNSPVSLVITNPVTKDVTIDLKSTTPVSHKNIVDWVQDSTDEGTKVDHYGNQRKADTAAENTAVAFELTFQIPSKWADQYKDGFWFTMNDTLSKGLDFDGQKSVKIKVGDSFTPSAADVDWDASTLYTAPTAQVSTDGKSLTWNFGKEGATEAADLANNKANLKLAGKWVKVYYTAHLNDDAVIASTGNDNAYDVTYQHDPRNNNGGEKTPTEHPHVYTFQFNLKKVDGDSTTTQLEGAQFQVKDSQGNVLKFDSHDGAYDYNPDGSVDTVTTPASGNIEFQGLKEGTYKLHETKAPEGYRGLGSDVTVTITATNKETQTDKIEQDVSEPYTIKYTLATTGQADIASDSDITIDVKNYKGFLPKTGAAGIVVLVLAGAALLAGGVITLVRQRRRA